MSDERAANGNDRRIGQRVRTRRLELGMSQERLAEILGVTFQQVQKYEKGVNRIAASRLFDIACALDMPVGRFFEGLVSSGGLTACADSAPDEVGASLATPEGARMASLFARIKRRPVRQRVLGLVEAMAEEVQP